MMLQSSLLTVAAFVQTSESILMIKVRALSTGKIWHLLKLLAG